MIAVVIGNQPEEAADVAKEFKLGFPVIFEGPEFQKISEPYREKRAITTPHNVLIGRDGKVLNYFIGGRAARDGTLEKAVKELAEKK